jgi:hypothetical protein
MKIGIRNKDGYEDLGAIYLSNGKVFIDLKEPYNAFFENGFDSEYKHVWRKIRPEDGVAYMKALVANLQRSFSYSLTLEDRDTWYNDKKNS